MTGARRSEADDRMAAIGNTGMLLYKMYRALSYVITPLAHLHLRWRRRRGLEHPTRWVERLGRPSLPRPSGPLLWFHAVSLGEGMAAVPVIKRCIECRPDISVLMTTTTLSAFEVIKNQLPSGVLYQFSPLDTPAAVNAFLDYWKPDAIMILESELWPNLIMCSSRKGISLALLNARVSMKSFRLWSQPVLLPLISLMLSKFSLIIPLSTVQAIHFQILQAPPYIINFAGDLKFAIEYDASSGDTRSIQDLKERLACRHVWMASSIHKGEEKVMLGVHKALIQAYPDLITIIVPRYPQHGQDMAQSAINESKNQWKNAYLQSKESIPPSLDNQEYISILKRRPSSNSLDCILPPIGIAKRRAKCSSEVSTSKDYARDKNLCGGYIRLSPVAVIGGSFIPDLAGHNLSEAAAAGCAVLTGHHVGHFSHMVKEMQRLNPLSVIQVSGTLALEQAIMELFSDAKVLEARRMAAKQAFHALSSGIIGNVWNLLNFHVLRHSL